MLDHAEHDRAIRAAFGDELEAGHVDILIGVCYADLKIAYEE
jgi:hypothetical protein